MVSRKLLTLLALGLLVAGVAIFTSGGRNSHQVSYRGQEANETPLPTDEVKLRAYIARNASSGDPKLQDRVGAARIRLGYAAAQRRDWNDARSKFLTAVHEYKGTGNISADFGGVPDQAAYQATVCLGALGKKAEAEREFRQFIVERPLSPLCKACYRRLQRLQGGTATPEDDRLIQTAITKQEKEARFQMSVCGPKVVEYLLSKNLLQTPRPLQHTTTPDYRVLAKLCGTKDSGTTIEGMRHGLSSLGLQTYAFQLSRASLAKITGPAILLESDHYVALLKVGPSSVRIYDPLYRSEMSKPLPPIDDPDFSVNAILFSKPESHS